MANGNSRTGADAPVPSEEGSLTLASPIVRSALRGATDAHSEASRATDGLLAALEALDEALFADVKPEAWGLFQAVMNGAKCLQLTLRDAEESCSFIDMRLLRADSDN